MQQSDTTKAAQCSTPSARDAVTEPNTSTQNPGTSPADNGTMGDHVGNDAPSAAGMHRGVGPCTPTYEPSEDGTQDDSRHYRPSAYIAEPRGPHHSQWLSLLDDLNLGPEATEDNERRAPRGDHDGKATTE